MAKMSRDKGKAGEREVVALLREAYDPSHTRGMLPIDRIRRGLQGQGDKRGEVVPDVIAPGLWVEVKRHATMPRGTIIGGLEQAERAADGSGLIPCCWHRADRGEWYVTLRFGDLAPMAVHVAPCATFAPEIATMHYADFCALWARYERGNETLRC